MESYTTILKKSKFEYEDRKSIFIGQAAPVSTEQEAINFIENVRKEYPDARHHVYAYVLRENSTTRYSDDREPQGTAGMPVLDVIRKKGCTDTVIVVTRYFGGTLLGTGGLVKAYTSAAAGAIEDGTIATYDIYTDINISASYSDYQKFGPIFTEFAYRITGSRFTDKVEINGNVKKANADDMLKALVQSSSGRIKYEVIGEKFDY